MHDEAVAALDQERRVKYHRRVYRLLYLAKRVAPDILLIVSLSSSHVASPTVQDWDCLERVYRYLNGQSDRVVKYPRLGVISICSFIDASFACYLDKRSRTGCVLLCCGAYVGAWSTRQDLNTKSSTESELVGATDECGWLISGHNWLGEQGYSLPPPVLYQDNTSVVDILKRGPGAQMRTRHLSIRFYFLGDLMRRGEIIITYCKTEDMLADGLTKPLVGEAFRRIREALVKVTMA
jgi:hypothetical protein